MDDDVVPAPDCLDVLMAVDEGLPDGGPRGHPRAAGREGRGHASTCATRCGSSPRPRWSRRRTAPARRCRSWSRSRTSPSRGSWSAAGWSRRSGCPTRASSSSTTTSTSPCAPAGPASTIWAVRDAVLVRQLDFDQQHDLAGWKGYYMYRNLFTVHLRYGENATGPRQALADHRGRRRRSRPLRGGRAEVAQRAAGRSGTRGPVPRADGACTADRASAAARRRRARPAVARLASTTGRCRRRRRSRRSSSGSAPRCRTGRSDPAEVDRPPGDGAASRG